MIRASFSPRLVILEVLSSEENHGLRNRSFRIRTARRIVGDRKLLLVVVAFLLVGMVVAYRRLICWPRDDTLIEFHIHSRGHGHWAGAIVTIEALAKLGYKFRLFAGRDPPVQPAPYDPQVIDTILRGEQPPVVEPIQRELLRYTHIAQATMQEPFFERLYLGLKASVRSPFLSRPLLIITDGDVAGLVQGWWNGIPTLALVHGNIFVQPPPSWVTSNLSYKKAWKVENRKNSFNNLWADYKIGFNHVPLPNMVHIGAREAVQEIARLRANQIAAFDMSNSKSPTKHRRVVSSYFRDKNGGKLVNALLEEGIDVIVFGELEVAPSTMEAEGRLIRIDDAAYFVPIMTIADGIIGSAGCNLAAECYYAQIPMLMLHSDWDTEHRLNAAMARQTNTYKDGSRAMFSCPFAELTSGAGELHQEVRLFIERVQASKASEAFYERLNYDAMEPSSVEYENELLEGSSDQMTEVLRVIKEVKTQALC